MAAASVGALQAGFVSAPIIPSTSQQPQPLYQPNHQLQAHQIIHQQPQHCPPIHHDPNSIIQQQALLSGGVPTANPHPSRIQYLDRSDNFAHINVYQDDVGGSYNDNSNSGGCSSDDTGGTSDSGGAQHFCQAPNVAPGWDRQVIEGDVVYFR